MSRPSPPSSCSAPELRRGRRGVASDARALDVPREARGRRLPGPRRRRRCGLAVGEPSKGPSRRRLFAHGGRSLSGRPKQREPNAHRGGTGLPLPGVPMFHVERPAARPPSIEPEDPSLFGSCRSCAAVRGPGDCPRRRDRRPGRACDAAWPSEIPCAPAPGRGESSETLGSSSGPVWAMWQAPGGPSWRAFPASRRRRGPVVLWTAGASEGRPDRCAWTACRSTVSPRSAPSDRRGRGAVFPVERRWATVFVARGALRPFPVERGVTGQLGRQLP